MDIEGSDQHITQAFRRFYQLLPQTDDQVLHILKAHLLVEEQLRLLVDNRLINPKALLPARLECNQIICIAEAFCSNDLSPVFWEMARKLNKLRNDIAHQLEPKGIEGRMSHFVGLIGMRNEGETLLDDFCYSVFLLHFRISTLVVPRKK